MAKILLENMEFHAFHGVLEHEKQLGNRFLVTVEMDVDTTEAGRTDDLNDTLNYQLVYDAISEEMRIPSELIEHISQRIINKLKNEFPQIQKLKLKLSKLSPPLGGKVETVSILLEA